MVGKDRADLQREVFKGPSPGEVAPATGKSDDGRGWATSQADATVVPVFLEAIQLAEIGGFECTDIASAGADFLLQVCEGPSGQLRTYPEHHFILTLDLYFEQIQDPIRYGWRTGALGPGCFFLLVASARLREGREGIGYGPSAVSLNWLARRGLRPAQVRIFMDSLTGSPSLVPAPRSVESLMSERKDKT